MQNVSIAGSWFTVSWIQDRLIILDQRQLPGAENYVALETVNDVFDAIKHLMVRGAPAIGIVAAWGLVLACRNSRARDAVLLLEDLRLQTRHLESARPTAINLSWSLHRMLEIAQRATSLYSTPSAVCQVLAEEAKKIQVEDETADRAIGEQFLSLLGPVEGILTHCNAGQLATSRYGTALAPIYVGVAKGRTFHVFVDETRPVLQGARLTAWELEKLGVDCTLICDNMSATVMAQKKIDAVIVGADCIAANGDVANKIGTLGVAILAKHYGIPFYVAAPMSTIAGVSPLMSSQGRKR